MQQDTAVQIFTMPGLAPADAAFQVSERVGDDWVSDLIWVGANPNTLTIPLDSGLQPTADLVGYDAWKRSAVLRMQIERMVRIDQSGTAEITAEPLSRDRRRDRTGRRQVPELQPQGPVDGHGAERHARGCGNGGRSRDPVSALTGSSQAIAREHIATAGGRQNGGGRCVCSR